MALTKEERNREEINTFLKNNDISPNTAMGYDNKFETRYYVGDNRKFAEETRIGFNIIGTSDIHVNLHEINDIEFETAFKITEQMFSYDEDNETLTITGDASNKHNEAYKIIISSIYLDLS
ncbi:hypothetical protein [Sulfurovum sp.]|uniref:hypothetical protein n=1 Tax=Sulfurovum sp. TaxID=1969726 RepID=UPI003563882B